MSISFESPNDAGAAIRSAFFGHRISSRAKFALSFSGGSLVPSFGALLALVFERGCRYLPVCSYLTQIASLFASIIFRMFTGFTFFAIFGAQLVLVVRGGAILAGR
tara:strand:+ start:341 stop:658 length:318 start_codon:yes stop_codon:yes gene_type:complete